LGWSVSARLCGIRLALCSALFCGTLLGPNPSASITSWVSDTSDAAIPAASVTLTGVDTGVTLKTETNTGGICWISGSLAGPYRIDISKEGFASVTEQGIELHVGETALLNYQLVVGSVRETATVEALAILLDSATSTIGQALLAARDGSLWIGTT
jgi:Carboxypeptidase regulatory-like domain